MTNQYKIKFVWDVSISAPAGSGGSSYTFGTGDSRLRYLYTGASPPASFAGYPIVYISGPASGLLSTTTTGITFQVLSPTTTTISGVTLSYVIGTGTGLTFTQSASLPSASSASSYFVNSLYTTLPPGGIKNILLVYIGLIEFQGKILGKIF